MYNVKNVTNFLQFFVITIKFGNLKHILIHLENAHNHTYSKYNQTQSLEGTTSFPAKEVEAIENQYEGMYKTLFGARKIIK